MEFTIALRVPGFTDGRIGTKEVKCFTIEKLIANSIVYGNRASENRIPLRENDLLCFMKNLVPARQRTPGILLSEDTEFGVVRKNPTNMDLEVMLLSSS